MPRANLSRGLAASVALTLALGAGSAAAQDAVTVVSFGGAMTRALNEAIYKPFTEATGIEVRSTDYNGGLGQVRAQVELDNVDWDVVQLEGGDPLLGCDEGLLEEIDPEQLEPAADGTPAAEDFIESGLLDCAAGTIVWSTVIAYHAEVFPDNPPQSIEDFFDLETFPGTRGLRRSPITTLEWALLADGVPRKDVYDVLATPEGVDRAFAKLDTIKDSVIWWEAGAQAPQLLGDREVVMTAAWNGRIFDARVNENQPFEIIWDTQIMAIDHWAIPRGTPRMEQAMAFLKFATAPENSGRISEYIAYGSPRASAAEFTPINAETGMEMAPHLPTHPDNARNALVNNIGFWNDYTDDLLERFSSWLLQ